MKIKGYIENQDDINVTLTITMTLKEWKDLDKDLPDRYPHWKLGSAITSAILQIQKTVSEEIEER